MNMQDALHEVSSKDGVAALPLSWEASDKQVIYIKEHETWLLISSGMIFDTLSLTMSECMEDWKVKEFKLLPKKQSELSENKEFNVLSLVDALPKDKVTNENRMALTKDLTEVLTKHKIINPSIDPRWEAAKTRTPFDGPHHKKTHARGQVFRVARKPLNSESLNTSV